MPRSHHAAPRPPADDLTMPPRDFTADEKDVLIRWASWRLERTSARGLFCDLCGDEIHPGSLNATTFALGGRPIFSCWRCLFAITATRHGLDKALDLPHPWTARPRTLPPPLRKRRYGPSEA